MKNQRQNGSSSRRNRPKSKWRSKRMNLIQRDVNKSNAYMRLKKGNTNKNAIAKIDRTHGRKTFGSSKMVNDRMFKSSYNVEDEEEKGSSPTKRNPNNVRLSNTLMMNRNFAPIAKSASKSNHAPSPTSKDMKRPATSGMDDCWISSSKNSRRFKPTRNGDGSISKKSEKPLRSKDEPDTVMGCPEQSRRVKAKEGLASNSNNVERSNSQPNRLKAMVGLVPKEGNVGPLGPRSKELLNIDQQDDIVAREENNERLKSLKDKEVATTSQGSNLSVAKELLVPNEDNSNENERCQDKVVSVASSEGTMSDKVHFMCDDLQKREDILKAKEAPYSNSALKGNQVRQSDLRINSGNSLPNVGKDHSRHQRAEASSVKDDNCAILSSKHVDQSKFIERNSLLNGEQPDGCTQLDSRNQNAKVVEDSIIVDGVEFKRKRIEPLLEDEPEAHDDGDSEEEDEEVVNYRPTMKRRRYIETNEDEEADVGDQNPECAQNENAGLAFQTTVLKDHHTEVPMPFVSESIKQQCYSCTQPIDEPIWSGIFKIGTKEFVSLSAHLSTKACGEVWKLARTLQPVVKVTKLSRSEAWPKRWKASGPTSDSIGLYFFPHDMRPNEELDELVKEVIENDMVLRAVVSAAEMLIFPSILLPEQYQTFRKKHYLWGVFKRREDRHDKWALVEEQNGTGRFAQEEEMEEQHASLQQDEVQCEGPDQETHLMKHATHRGVEKEGVRTISGDNSRSPGKNTQEVEHQSPEEAKQQDVEQELTPSLAGSNASCLAEHTAKATAVTTKAAPPGKIFGFVAQQTPRLQQLIQQMEREGALVFAVREEMIVGPRSGAGNSNGIGVVELPPVNVQPTEGPSQQEQTATEFGPTGRPCELELMFPVQQQMCCTSRVEAGMEVDLDLSLSRPVHGPPSVLV